MTARSKVEHRSRALVDVKLRCGCVLTYEFEFETGQPSYARHSMVVAVPGGWWVPTSEHLGEITEDCSPGRLPGRCVMLFPRQAKTAVQRALREALIYMGGVAPCQREVA